MSDIEIEVDFETLPTGIDPRIMRDLARQEAEHAWPALLNRHDRRKEAARNRQIAKLEKQSKRVKA